MKKYCILISCLTLVACQDPILDKTQLDIVSDEVVWSDSKMVDAYLLQQYQNTPTMLGDSPDAKNTENAWLSYKMTELFVGPCLTAVMSDEARTGWWYECDIENYKSAGIGIEGGFSEYMELPYKTIRSLNEIIERLTAIDPYSEFNKVRIAEARFLRAFNYFGMVKRYGGVPLIVKVQSKTDPEEVLYPKRNTEKEVYDFILKEMDQIAPILSDRSEIGRADRYAALALQSRAALYAASIAQFGKVQLDGLLGFNASEAQAYYLRSIQASQNIMSSGKFALYNEDANKVDNFKNIFVKKNNREAIFVRQHDDVDALDLNGNSWGWNFVMAPKPHAWNSGWKVTPYLDMAEAFELTDGSSGKLDREVVEQGLWSMDELWKDRDPRFYATLWTNGTRWRNQLVDLHNGIITEDGRLLEAQNDSYQGLAAWGNQAVEGKFHTSFGVMKYCDEESAEKMNGKSAPSSNDYLIFRYAEILLNYAEAAFELGRTDEALDAVNQIRDRAGIARLTTISRDLIRHERRVELAFENHRFWDVRRWRIATTEFSTRHTGIRYILDYTTRKYKIVLLDDVDGSNKQQTFFERNYYFPITLVRTMANKNLVENPGYE